MKITDVKMFRHGAAMRGVVFVTVETDEGIYGQGFWKTSPRQQQSSQVLPGRNRPW